MKIAPVETNMASAVIALWSDAGLTRPWNDPIADLRRAVDGPASSVLVGHEDDELVATAMVGHDGHRGWVYYLAVDPERRGRGYGREMMAACEQWLIERGIPKLNLMVRDDNAAAQGFYDAIGYSRDSVVVRSRRLDT